MPKDEMQILSLNIWKGALISPLLDYINSQKDYTAIFCFQEAAPSALAQLQQALSDDFYCQTADKSIAGRDESYYLATFMRRGVETLESRAILGDHPDAGFGLLSVLDIDGRSLSVINVHGVAFPGDKLDNPVRVQQSRALVDELAAQTSVDLVIGDFNLLPETESVAIFERAGFRNLIKDFNIPTTRNEAAWQQYPDNKQLFADYAFTRHSDEVGVEFAVDDIVVSDHLPLRVKLSLSQSSIFKN